MKRGNLLIMPGGMYRCCVQTCNDWIAENPEAEVAEGDKIACRYEDGAMRPAEMIVNGGALHWFDPDYPPLKIE